MILTIPVGTSDPLEIELTDNGDPIPDAHAKDVEIEITDEDGAAVSGVTLTAEWTGASDTSVVKVTGHEDLPVGNYRVRFKLTDTQSKIGFAPNGHDADLWTVVAIHNRRANAV